MPEQKKVAPKNTDFQREQEIFDTIMGPAIFDGMMELAPEKGKAWLEEQAEKKSLVDESQVKKIA